MVKHRRCYLCDHKEGTDGNVSLHKFPSNDEVKMKWIEICMLRPEDNVSNLLICSKHFHSSDYVRGENKIYKHRYLKPTAIPFTKETLKLQSKQQNQLPIPVQKVDEIGRAYGETQAMTNDNLYLPTSATSEPSGSLNQDISITSHLGHAVNSGRYFRPRYMGDITSRNLKNPKMAKFALFIAKNSLMKQTERIRMLKNENRKLYRKLDRLTTLFKNAKKPPNKLSKNNETITVLMNI